MERKKKEATLPIVIPFEWMTQQYGRAEFQVCFQYKRRSLSMLYVYPLQQPDAKFTYEITPFPKMTGAFHLGSYEGLSDPKVWSGGYCQEHRGFVLVIYVPDNSKFLQIDTGLNGPWIGFHRTDPSPKRSKNDR